MRSKSLHMEQNSKSRTNLGGTAPGRYQTTTPIANWNGCGHKGAGRWLMSYSKGMSCKVVVSINESLLPSKFTADVCLDAVLEYLNYSEFDEGSARHLQLLSKKQGSSTATATATANATPVTGAARAKAIRLACEKCSEKLSPLESHLNVRFPLYFYLLPGLI